MNLGNNSRLGRQGKSGGSGRGYSPGSGSWQPNSYGSPPHRPGQPRRGGSGIGSGYRPGSAPGSGYQPGGGYRPGTPTGSGFTPGNYRPSGGGGYRPPNRRSGNGTSWLIPVVVVILAAIVAGFALQKPLAYRKGQSLLEDGSYQEAIAVFTELGNYQDSPDQIREANYRIAKEEMDRGGYEAAARTFEAMPDFRDAAEQAKECRYQLARDLAEQGRTQEAADAFSRLEDYEDSREQLLDLAYPQGVRLYNEGRWLEAMDALAPVSGDPGAAAVLEDSCCQAALGALEDGGLREGLARRLGEGEEIFGQPYYNAAHRLFMQERYDAAQVLFDILGNWVDLYGQPHFATLEDAREFLINNVWAIQEDGNLHELYIGEMPQGDEEQVRNALYDMTQARSMRQSYENKLLTIYTTPFPGMKIVKAWQLNDFSTLTEDERNAYNLAQSVVDQALAEAGGGFALEKWLCDWLCDHITYYTEEAYSSGTMEHEAWMALRFPTCVGALLDGRANCAGYSDAFYLLATLAGFQVRYQGGDATGPHEWNVIRLGEDWYHADITWVDYEQEDVYYDYAYLNFTLEDGDHFLHYDYCEIADVGEKVPWEWSYYDVYNLGFTTPEAAAEAYLAERRQGVTDPICLRIDGTCTGAEFNDVLVNAARNEPERISWTTYCRNLYGDTYLHICWRPVP